MDAVSGHEQTTIELQDDEMHNPRFLRHRHTALRDHRAASPKCTRPVSLRPRCRCPIYGVRASAGRRARMEDAVSIVENLLEVTRPYTFWKSDRMKCDLNSSNGSHSFRRSSEMCETEVCHFFGVYDGHNGPYAAHHCRGRLHENLRSSYLDLCSGWDSDTESVAVAVDLGVTASESNARDYSSSCSVSSEPSLTGQITKPRSPLSLTEEDVFLETFRRTDSQFSEYRCAERVGTTALAALVGSKHIAVGGCGDSRAVMYRKGQPIQLSNDHRLDKKEEKERIESSGGTVTYWNGPRVMGVLAMSRAIGDLCFRPYGVICDPDVATMTRSLDDEYLLLATDGLWDVLTNEEAYRIIRHTVASNQAQGVGMAECIQSSANRLTRIALDRGSRDNITVVLLDLQSDVAQEAQMGL